MNEDRLQVWNDYLAQGGLSHKIVRHMFVDYSRYHEAALIADHLSGIGVRLSRLKILDYGAGVGDYGMHFLRQGARTVAFYDYPRSTQFIDYRLKLEDLDGFGITISADEEEIVKFKEWDFVVFGEVLEHLEDPLSVLQQLVKDKVTYVFTSSYPYRSDDPHDPYWNNHDHDDGARLQMPECRKTLEENYNYIKFDGELRLWRLK